MCETFSQGTKCSRLLFTLLKNKNFKKRFSFYNYWPEILKIPYSLTVQCKNTIEKKKLHALGTQRKTRQNRFYPILVPAQKKLSYHCDSAKLLITAL